MTKAKSEMPVRASRDIRIAGFDPQLHRSMRAVAAERGIPAYKLYEEIVRAFLAKARRNPVA
jgi:hypothetical protein